MSLAAGLAVAMSDDVTAADPTPGGVEVTSVIADASKPLQRYDPSASRCWAGWVCGVSGYQSTDGDGGSDGGDTVVWDERLGDHGGEGHVQFFA